ncbi:hypothetical protein H7K45_12895 [Mycobacterium yunnanensis]|uniref:Small secreted domain n=1 Tax=Mycobacterium yunnanensis TaxID=368477 RepID=A0A9X2Z3Y1_9MYCO|nr:hypothetical protein [Mycobacterium yunnanensis]MCV7421442.1 hypothetical protein [Mycobacterium yunnanensis]
MIDLKAIAAGVGVAGALVFGVGAGVANAAPTDPTVPSVQGTSSQSDNHATSPSPYAAYDGPGMCATPGLYFVNICA